MQATRLRRLVRQVHLWLGLVIAAQLVLWTAGGLVMSALRLEEVRGDDLAAKRPVPALDAGAVLKAPAEVLGAHGAQATSLQLTTLLARPVYRLKGADGTTLVDAVSGAALSPLSRELAEQVARDDYRGTAPVAGIDWVETPAVEYRGRPLPLWRVRFADERNTALYVSPATGEVVARRNDLWRAFDFVWMLHIMDYEEREDFNHPLLVATAATALLFTFTGLVMLFYALRPGPRP